MVPGEGIVKLEGLRGGYIKRKEAPISYTTFAEY